MKTVSVSKLEKGYIVTKAEGLLGSKKMAFETLSAALDEVKVLLQ